MAHVMESAGRILGASCMTHSDLPLQRFTSFLKPTTLILHRILSLCLSHYCGMSVFVFTFIDAYASLCLCLEAYNRQINELRLMLVCRMNWVEICATQA